MGQLRQGASEGLGVMVGRVGSRALPGATGISSALSSSSTGIASMLALAGVQLVSGVLLSYLVKGIGGGGASRAVLAGTFDGMYEDLLGGSGSSVPLIGPYLGAYSSPLMVATSRAVRGYSRPAAVAVSARGYAMPGRTGPAGLRRIGIGGGRIAR